MPTPSTTSNRATTSNRSATPTVSAEPAARVRPPAAVWSAVSTRRAASSRLRAARAASVLTVALTLLALPSLTASLAEASEASPGLITNQRVGTFPLSGTLPSTCIMTDNVYLDGHYTYGQRFGASVTHDIIAMPVRAGTYALHDCVRDSPEMGTREQSSWLDPAPDPNDPTSGVIVAVTPLDGRDSVPTPGPTPWGSMLITEQQP